MKVSLRPEAAERPRWPRLYLMGRARSCDRMPSLVGDRRCIVCYTYGLCSNLLLNVGSVALTVISGYKRDFRETVRKLERTTVHPRLKYS